MMPVIYILAKLHVMSLADHMDPLSARNLMLEILLYSVRLQMEHCVTNNCQKNLFLF